MEGQLVKLNILPTKGIKYPLDIEIYVRPVSIKEQMDMDRYGISQAEYFQKVLDGVTIKGSFLKENLYYHDVQFLDLVRRLYTFDTKEEIVAKDYPCQYFDCDGTVDYAFNFEQLNYTELEEDIFGKEYTFSDGLQVVISPLTILDFIKMCKKYITNKQSSESDLVVAYYVASIKEVKDRAYASNEAKNEYLFKYISELYKNEDRKILEEIEEKTMSIIKPFEVTCPKCGRTTEVTVTPSMRFQQ